MELGEVSMMASIRGAVSGKFEPVFNGTRHEAFKISLDPYLRSRCGVKTHLLKGYVAIIGRTGPWACP